MNPRQKAFRAAIVMLLALDILVSAVWAFMPRDDLRDFGSFVASGAAANRGDDPFGVYPQTFVVQLNDHEVPAPNLNPPIAVYPFRLLAHVDGGKAMAAMRIGSLLLFGAMAAYFMRRNTSLRTPLAALWLFSLAGMWHTVELGQIYMLLVAASTAAFFLSPRQPLLAGLLIGIVVAVKPTFAVWPALLFLAGYRRTSLTSLGTAAALSLVPLAIDGPTIYRQWFDASRAFSGMTLPGNGSLLAIADRAGVEPAGIAASAVLLAALAVWAFRVRPDVRQASMAGILGALALGPITWAGYALFALPFLVTRPWGGWEKLFATMLTVPFWLVFPIAAATPLLSFLVGPLYGWAILGMLAVNCLATRTIAPPISHRHRVDDRAHLPRRSLNDGSLTLLSRRSYTEYPQRAVSSAGRALPSHGRGHRFKSCTAHHPSPPPVTASHHSTCIRTTHSPELATPFCR